MHTWIALLRGINVGGNNILPMQELVDDLKSLGLDEIRTYIQSGNAVFTSQPIPGATLASAISAKIEERHGFRPQVLLLSTRDLQAAIDANPFPEAESDPKSLHFFFLASPPSAPDIRSLDDAKTSTERFFLTDRVFYLHAPDGIGRSKLAANAERYLGVASTARNWRTVQKLSEMTSGASSLR